MESINKQTNNKKNPIPKKKITLTIIIIAITFFGAFLAYFILQSALNTQYPLVIVISDSMEPNINRGDLLIISGVEPEDIKAGDIDDKDGDVVLFDARGLWDDAPNEPVVHRVVRKWYNDNKSMWFFYTKGDANFHVDYAEIPEDRILGKVIGRIPYIGWVKIVLVDFGVYYILIIALIILIVVSMIRDVIKEEEQDDKTKQEN